MLNSCSNCWLALFKDARRTLVQNWKNGKKQKTYHHFFKNLSEIDNIIQEEEEIFKKNPTVVLLEVSKLIDSAISKRQGDRGKHSFLERKKKYCIKGNMDSL